VYCGPEVLFETCIAMKFADDDDNDDDDDAVRETFCVELFVIISSIVNRF